MDGSVRCLYTDTLTNSLFIGGNFVTSGGDTTWGITKWNGVTYDSLGGGMMDVGACFPVQDIIRYKGNIYAGGWGNPAIAKWDGNSWVNVGGGIDGLVLDFYIYNDELYVSGLFDTVGTIAVNGLAKWNDTTWSDVHAIPNYTLSSQNKVYCSIMFQGELYVGGNFSGNGGNEIVKWDGVSWQTVGGGFQGGFASVLDMTIYNNDLYVAGSFTKPAGNPADAIAKWDGVSWSEVGGGMTNANGVFDLQVFNNELYAVGGFTMAGGVPAYTIAKWDGNEWCGLGVDSSGNGISSIEIYNNEIYVDCDIILDNDTVNYIAKWIGANYTDTCGSIVGINDNIEWENGITIYPNPNNGNFTINIDNTKNANIEIYNISGQLILQKTLLDNTTKIDLTKYSKGMYFVKIVLANQPIVRKLVYH